MEIPDDIRAAAVAVVERGYDEGLIDAVARAILAERLAERERCAVLIHCGCSNYCDFDEAEEMIRGQA